MLLPRQAHAVMRGSSVYRLGGVEPALSWEDVGNFFTQTLPGVASDVLGVVGPVLGQIAKPLVSPACSALCQGNSSCIAACEAGGNFLAGKLTG